MPVEQPHDARSVANLMLDLADGRGWPLTNLALQKLLYFAHARFLIEHQRPLVTGYFEAWKHGPVHPAVYACFKPAGAEAIDTRARRVDIASGTSEVVPPVVDLDARDVVHDVIRSLGRMSTWALVDVAHAPNGPWDYVVNKGKTRLAFGLRIPDNVIKERFKFHKIAVSGLHPFGEPGEDSPIA